MENTDLEYIKKDLELLQHEKKIINPEYGIASTLEQQRYFEIINGFLKSKKPEEKFEEYKDFILNPKYNSVMDILIEMLAKKNELHGFLKKNFQQIRESTNINNICRLYTEMKDILPEEYEKHKFIIEDIYNSSYEKLHSITENEQLSGIDFSVMMKLIDVTCARIILQDKTKNIEEFIKSVSKDNSLEIMSLGGNSIIIRAGDKIIKLGGKTRESGFDIINHPRLLRPIIRKNISTNEEQPLYFEVQEEVDTTNITEQDVLEVYKELREAGIKWCDPRVTNLGRLKKPNNAFPIGQGPEASNNSLGLIGEDSDRIVLPTGELVILDLDYIYRADDPRAKLVSNASMLVRDYENNLPRIKPEKASMIALETLTKDNAINKLIEARGIEESALKREDRRETKDD